MGSTLARRIGARIPLPLGEEAAIALAVAAGDIGTLIEAVLSEHDTTSRHYYVLRMLRGAGAQGLSHGDIGARLLARSPDVTRLMTSLVRRRWVVRRRGDEDARVVRHMLTPAGETAVRTLDAALRRIHDALLDDVGETTARQLVRNCERVIEFASSQRTLEQPSRATRGGKP